MKQMALFEDELDELTGQIIRYTFSKPDYSVVVFETEAGNTINIVGAIPQNLPKGVTYKVYGKWTTHKKYGLQLKFHHIERLSEITESSLVSYLSGDIFTGVGPKTAQKIVNLFGVEAIQKILDDKSVLEAVFKSEERQNRFYEELLENEKSVKINTELFSMGFSAVMAKRVIDSLGLSAPEIIRNDPYILIYKVDGFGFNRADNIAMNIGIKSDDERRIKAAVLYVMQEASHGQGYTYLTLDQIVIAASSFLQFNAEFEKYLIELEKDGQIVIEEDRYYLSDIYESELYITNGLYAIDSYEGRQFEDKEVINKIEDVEKSLGYQFTNDQKAAILSAIKNKITVVTGGPGTGKTTVIQGIIEVYRRLYPTANLSAQVKVMAPTGKAAKRISEILSVNASTIHSGLKMHGLGKIQMKQIEKLNQKLIIVDEFSMVDIYLAEALIRAINPEARLVIVGDVDQLPSIGPGQVLSDIINSEKFMTVRLTQIQRQAALSDVVYFANKINHQTIDFEDINFKGQNDLYLYQKDEEDVKDFLLVAVERSLEQGYSMIDDIQVIIPVYGGELGIDNINALIQNAYIEPADRLRYCQIGENTFYKGDKVMQLENNYDKEIMNGDIGYIKEILLTKDEEQNQNEAILTVDFDGHEVNYTRDNLNDLTLAYAISTHKSQGSEYAVVIMPVVRAYNIMLKKELLYTAVTRAKEYLFIMGDLRLIIRGSGRTEKGRQSTLINRLRGDILRKDVVEEEKEDEQNINDFSDSPYDFM